MEGFFAGIGAIAVFGVFLFANIKCHNWEMHNDKLHESCVRVCAPNPVYAAYEDHCACNTGVESRPLKGEK